MKNKKQIVSILIVILTVAVMAASLYAAFSWYMPDSPSGYVFELVADSVYSIYFSSTDVDTEGDLIPAKAMPGAVAEGKNFDVKRLYNPADPEPSYVSEIAQNLSYSTTFINRGADTILVEYDWYITLPDNPLERLDKDEFVLNVDFWNMDLEQAIVPDANNRFYLSPIGDSRTIQIAVNVTMYFAKVDELMDPRIKDSTLLVTIDLRRIWELSQNGYMEIRYATDDPQVSGTLYPGQNPISYTKDFAYSGASSYLADTSWMVEHYDSQLEPQLFDVELTFINKATQQQIIPDINGRINIPANATVQVTAELSFAYAEALMQTHYPQLLNQKLYVTISVGTAP